METVFSDTAVFCANCGHRLEPGDLFCKECGSKQTREVNIEGINVDKKMELRASALLPGIDRTAFRVPLMSDGMPARGMLDPGEASRLDFQPPVFRPTVVDVSLKHGGPVEIRSTVIDVFNFRFSNYVPVSDEDRAGWYPFGDYRFHLIRTSEGARCRIVWRRYNDSRDEVFDTDAFALTRLDRLLKERDVAQLDGYSVHSPGAANHMDLLVEYAGGERIAATGLPPDRNRYYNAEWFMDFFRNLSGAFGKNIFTDSFKEREAAERQAAAAKGNGAADNVPGHAASQGFWQCCCGMQNTGPFCSECGRVRPKT